MTKTLQDFTEALDAAFEGVSKKDLKRLLASWGRDVDEDHLENSLDELKTSLKNQFESWPNILKDTVTINREIDESSDGSHRFLSFKGADLRGADLSGADLSDADLSDANLTGADLSDVDLGGADLNGANLTGADLSDVDMSGVDLGGADLSGADLTTALELVERRQNSRITFSADKTIIINEKTKLSIDLLCCYFNPKLYQNDTENSIPFDNFADFAKAFTGKYLDSSNPRVTPLGSTHYLKVSGYTYINAWVAAMLPALKEVWDAREDVRNNDPARTAIDEFMNALNAAGDPQNG
jgi:uncharacterized protein YjbI with pentapeptide repeats